MSNLILAIDDSAVVRATVRCALEGAGMEVVEADDGATGLAALEQMSQDNRRPALILTDLNMPTMDGITFIRRVKQTACKFIPILVLTTESQADKKLEGKRAGAAGWIVKPFKGHQLIDVIHKFVR